MGSVIKKRRKRMSKKKHRKLLRRPRFQRSNLGKLSPRGGSRRADSARAPRGARAESFVGSSGARSVAESTARIGDP